MTIAVRLQGRTADVKGDMVTVPLMLPFTAGPRARSYSRLDWARKNVAATATVR